ncbi:MAG: phosphatase PAP2 family protein [Solirubrobacteraceae bacterium]
MAASDLSDDPGRGSAPAPETPPRTSRITIATVAACILLVAVLGWLVRHDGALPRWDARVVADLADGRSDATVDLARAITLLGDFRVLLAGTLVLAVVAMTVRGRTAVVWALPAVSLIVAGALNPLLKAIVDRPRPPEVLHRVAESSPGFPSGHAAQSASAWLCLGLVLWASRRSGIAVAACVVVTTLVGVSRVVLAVHSPTDVVAGWAVGLAVALVVLALASSRPGRRPA